MPGKLCRPVRVGERPLSDPLFNREIWIEDQQLVRLPLGLIILTDGAETGVSIKPMGC